MSEGVQKAAGTQLRSILRTVTKNRFLGVVTGFLTTAIVQSSSATTVMTVSFVNAGLISLVESAGVMMGANIGTTITGWLVSVLGFSVVLGSYSLPLVAIAIPLIFFGKNKFKYWGEFILGFSILFLGLMFLENSIPALNSDGWFFNTIKDFSQYGIWSRLFFVIIGAIATIMVQSSSAAMAITLALVYKGWLPLDVACAMVLGENIGTTITAELASLVGNVHAKRSARIHSLFNLIGVAWMVILLPYVLNFLIGWVENFTFLFDSFIKVKDGLSYRDQINTYTLAAFHTFFNLMNVLLLIGFVPWLVKIATRTIKGRDDGDEGFKLKYISASTITPEISILEAQKEVARFGEVTSRMSSFVRDLLDPIKSQKNQKSLLKKLRKYEEITDRFEIELTEYLTKVSKKELTPNMSIHVRSIMSVGNDLERIGDIFYQISKTIEKKKEDKIWFNQHQRNRINEILDLIDKGFLIMINNLKTPNYKNVSKSEALKIENQINLLRDEIRIENRKAIEMDEEYNIVSAMVYNNIFSSIEKIGDHLINITEAIVGDF